jgi:hypothetical protein
MKDGDRLRDMPNSLGLKEPGENWYLEYILSFFSDTVFGII